MTVAKLINFLNYCKSFGKSLHDKKQRTVAIRELRKRFSMEPKHCSSLNSCIFQLTQRYVKTKNDIEKLYPHISEVLNLILERPLTAFGRYRNDIDIARDNKEYIIKNKLLYQNADTHKIQQARAKQLVEDYQDKTIFIDDNKIQEVVDIALKDDANIAEKTIALMFASGARAQEILNENVADFQVTKKGEILQIGQAKAKNPEQQIEYRKHQIHKGLSHMKTDDFMRLLDDVRNDVPKKIITNPNKGQAFREHVAHNRKISTKFISRMAPVMKKLLPEQAKEITRLGVHFGRKAFPASVRNNLSDKNELGQTKYLLGHQSVHSSLSYRGVEVRKDIDIEKAERSDLEKEVKYIHTKLNKLIETVQQINDLKQPSKKQKVSDNKGVHIRHIQRINDPEQLSNSTVELVSKDKSIKVLQKFKKSRHTDDEYKRKKAQAAVQMLNDHDIKVSYNNLKKLGIAYKNLKKYI